MSDELRGRTALVTGAARRIGREIALALAAAGVNVAVHHRASPEEAAQLKAGLIARGVKAWVVQADLNEDHAPGRLISNAVSAAGPLDFLVNNASVRLAGMLDEIDFAALMLHMRLNAWSPLALSREFVRNAARAGCGKIVNLLDARPAIADRAHAAYALSKYALRGLTEMMALEYAPDVTVNGVAPGLILPPAGRGPEYMSALATGVPMRRCGAPDDVADAVLYLLGSRYVTGQVLCVDGGLRLAERTHGPDHHH